MNKVIRLSQNTVVEKSIAELDKDLESYKDIPNFQLLHSQAVSIIKELVLKAKSLSSSNTKIHVKKEIIFNDLRVMLILNSPEKKSTLDRVKQFFSN